jgi:hypothetical protein
MPHHYTKETKQRLSHTFLLSLGFSCCRDPQIALMLVAGLRARVPRCILPICNVHIRGVASESTVRVPSAEESRCFNTANLSKDTAVPISDEKDVVLDPIVQAQLKRMLRVDHAGEFAAGDFNS